MFQNSHADLEGGAVPFPLFLYVPRLASIQVHLQVEPKSTTQRKERTTTMKLVLRRDPGGNVTETTDINAHASFPSYKPVFPHITAPYCQWIHAPACKDSVVELNWMKITLYTSLKFSLFFTHKSINVLTETWQDESIVQYPFVQYDSQRWWKKPQRRQIFTSTQDWTTDWNKDSILVWKWPHMLYHQWPPGGGLKILFRLQTMSLSSEEAPIKRFGCSEHRCRNPKSINKIREHKAPFIVIRSVQQKLQQGG